jgi:GNAT superfamily N-acetyltransferase
VPAQGDSDRGDGRDVSTVEKSGSSVKPIVVERLTHQDVNDICALYKRVWESYRPTLPGELIKAWQPTPLEFTSWMEGVTYFAARRDGRMIGAIGCRVSDQSCRLVHLVVDPEHRRQGVATALTAAAIEWARHANTRSVWVDALAKFEAAAEVLKRLGFTDAGMLHRHYFGEDVRLLEMTL